jgi:predicted DNA-binding transcriptional regulator AlpA
MARKLADDLCYPPRAMRADRAAAYLSLATSTFLKLVDEKRLPKGKRLGGIVFWDRAELDAFVEHYEGETDAGAASEDKWSKILGN